MTGLFAIRPFFRGLSIAVFGVVVPLSGSLAAAGPPAGFPAQELERLVTTLENDAQRDKLIADIKALIAADKARRTAQIPARRQNLAARALTDVSAGLKAAGDQVGDGVKSLAEVPAALGGIYDRLADEEIRQRWIEIAGKLLLVLLAGIAAEQMAIRLMRRPRRALQSDGNDGWGRRAAGAVGFAVVDLLHIAAFALAAYGTLALTAPRPVTQVLALAIISANVTSRLIAAVARAALSPTVAAMRPLPASDETAGYLYVWSRRIAVPVVYGHFTAAALEVLDATALSVLASRLFGLAVATLTIVFVLQNRSAVAAWLRGSPATQMRAFEGIRRRLAVVWHVLMIAYIVALYGVWALEIENGFIFLLQASALSLALIVAGRWLAAGVRALVDRYFHLSPELRSQMPGLEERANRYLPLIQRVLAGAIWVLVGVFVLEAWSIRILAWLGGDLGLLVASRLARILLVFVGALVAWEALSALTERYLRRAGDGSQGRTRARTLLPFVRNAIRVVLAVMVALLILDELGINIAPLLAGAGVVGLALGFGAQSLVKDVITGIFILVEDSIAVGDVVEIAGHSGLVEGMTIRTIRLRDLGGNVHTVPFSEVSAVLNMTRDFAFSLIDVGIAYRENVDAVIGVLNEIAETMRADPNYQSRILEPLEVLGLDSFGDSSVNIRIRLKTAPMQQWAVKREFHRRMKIAFDERGIEIPFPHRTLYFGVDRAGKAPPARIVVDKDREQTDPASRAGPAPAPSR